MLKQRKRSFRDWWRAPITASDRRLAAFVGGLGGFWIGALGRIALGTTPVSLMDVGAWGLAFAACSAALGVAFPKPVTVILFPLSVFGVGS
jgi:hypothetical protein